MGFDTRVLTGVGVLAAVTEAGSFARAAETLGLTPSGVSRAVARLEGRDGILERIVFATGDVLDRRAMFFSAGEHQGSDLAARLGCAFTAKGAVNA